MWYIINDLNEIIAKCDIEPDSSDLATRTEIAIESILDKSINELEYDGFTLSEKDLTPTTEEKWADIRKIRDKLLISSDFTQLIDAPFDQTTKDAWATYRQELRDIPTTYATPEDVVWPTKPS